MSSFANEELKARGVAQVIVILKEAQAATAAGGPAGSPITNLSKHFVTSENSQASFLASAAASGRAMAASMRQGSESDVRRPDNPIPTAVQYFPNLGIALGTVNEQGLAALRKDPQVESVSSAPVMSLIRPQRVASARLTRKVTWGITALRVPDLWKQGITGEGVLVGHLDTGVDGEHPALAGAIRSFAEFDDLGRQVQPAPSPFDTDEHGTHTAATIAGRTVKGRSVGVAPGAELASAIVIEGGDVTARILGGMDWAVGNGVRVLSMSLGIRGYSDSYLSLTQLLRARNILPVFAVGNEGPGTSRSPGNYAEALSVGACDQSNNVADFSSSMRFVRADDPLVPDVVAPGVGVISAKPGGGYQSMDGSSMATPHVAGLAALLMSARPVKSASEIESAIFQSCQLFPTMPPDRANRGIPDAVKALSLL